MKSHFERRNIIKLFFNGDGGKKNYYFILALDNTQGGGPFENLEVEPKFHSCVMLTLHFDLYIFLSLLK
jgi:hypothetical protein